ncbi:MAG: MFS transporter [Eubacteriales bacterium]|nr:MFS transporter [Eubacteriales bacterium]
MKNQTLRYSLTQFTFWAASTGAASFAATYLLGQGIASEIVGLLLAAAGLLSCLTQPVLAGMADRAGRFVLKKVLVGMSLNCVLCFAVQLFPGMPMGLASLCYMAGIWCSDAMVPLVNALCISYTQAGYPINYGAARGVGSVAFALSSLTLGFIIARLGSGWMLLFLVGFRLLSILILLSYPAIEKPKQAAASSEESCSVGRFFTQYRWYCASLLGILFLGMYHAMTENYLIAILGRLGGDSSHVGKALFISSMVGAEVIFFIDKIRRFLPDTCLLKISACTFLLKAVLFYFAGSIGTIYLLQLLQMTSYAFLDPIQVYYAKAKVRQADMVKGQAFVTAAYALGCSAGNFAGGQLLPLGVDAILIAGIAMAAAGTVILFLTVNREDCFVECG